MVGNDFSLCLTLISSSRSTLPTMAVHSRPHPAAILNRFVIPAVNDYPALS